MRRRSLVSALLLVQLALFYGFSVGNLLPRLAVVAPMLVFLLRGRAWAYGAALAWSAGLSAIIALLDLGTVFDLGIRGEAWFGTEPWYVELAPYLALELLAVVAGGAAFALLLRDGGHEDTRRRVLGSLALAFCAQVALMGLIFVFGVGSKISGHTLPQELLSLSQAPGDFVVTGVVGISEYLSHVLDPFWGGIRLFDIPMMMAANTFGLLPITLFLLASRDARRASVSGGGPAPEIPRAR